MKFSPAAQKAVMRSYKNDFSLHMVNIDNDKDKEYFDARVLRGKYQLRKFRHKHHIVSKICLIAYLYI